MRLRRTAGDLNNSAHRPDRTCFDGVVRSSTRIGSLVLESGASDHNSIDLASR